LYCPKGRTCGAAENTIKQTVKAMLPFKEKIMPTDYKITGKQSTSETAAKI
jgi:hypothetical protein